MAALTTSQGISLNISPLMDSDSSIISCKIIEKVNGFMPTIEVIIKTLEDITNILDKQTLVISTSQGGNLESECYVYSIDYLDGNCAVKMMPVSSDFMRVPHTSKFKGGEDTLSVYGNNIDKSVTSDILSSVTLYQKNESNYRFLTRILKAYRRNSIFAYTIGGLVIRDLTTYKPLLKVNRLGQSTGDIPQTLSNPKRFESEPEVVDRFANHLKVKFHDQIYDVNAEYETLICNRLMFERMSTTKSNYTYSTPELYDATLCDFIDYYSSETKVTNTYIAGRVIEFSLTDVRITYQLNSIDPL